MVWISIEGSIGSGKTTVIDEMIDTHSTPNIGIYKEPIVEWKSYLDLFYSDKIKYGFMMQTRVIVSFSKIYKSFANKKLAITERSSYSSQNVFTRMLFDQGLLTPEEVKLLVEIVETTHFQTHPQPQKKLQPDYFIYLRTNPEVCYQRIINRNDKPIDFNYLKSLCHYHDKIFLNKPNVFVIDTSNIDRSTVKKKVTDFIRSVHYLNSRNKL